MAFKISSRKDFFQKYNFISKKSNPIKYLNKSNNLKKLEPLSIINRSLSSKHLYSLRNLKKDYVREKLQTKKNRNIKENLKIEIDEFFKSDIKIKKIIKVNFEYLKKKKFLKNKFFGILLNLKNNEKNENLKIFYFCDINFFAKIFFESFGKNLFHLLEIRYSKLNSKFKNFLKCLITSEICLKIENEENKNIYDLFYENKNLFKPIKEKKRKIFIENEFEKKIYFLLLKNLFQMKNKFQKKRKKFNFQNFLKNNNKNIKTKTNSTVKKIEKKNFDFLKKKIQTCLLQKKNRSKYIIKETLEINKLKLKIKTFLNPNFIQNSKNQMTFFLDKFSKKEKKPEISQFSEILKELEKKSKKKEIEKTKENKEIQIVNFTKKKKIEYLQILKMPKISENNYKFQNIDNSEIKKELNIIHFLLKSKNFNKININSFIKILENNYKSKKDKKNIKNFLDDLILDEKIFFKNKRENFKYFRLLKNMIETNYKLLC